jgi:hypothetical protein
MNYQVCGDFRTVNWTRFPAGRKISVVVGMCVPVLFQKKKNPIEIALMKRRDAYERKKVCSNSRDNAVSECVNSNRHSR